MRIYKPQDFVGHLFCHIEYIADKLPKPLQWIEPSINNLFLESVFSLLIGNAESSIFCMSALMEHVLRLANLNTDEIKIKTTTEINKMDKGSYLSNLIEESEQKIFFKDCDIEWWKQISKNIRNKSAHYLLPVILRNCAKVPKLEKYIKHNCKPENVTKKNYFDIVTDWGAFYHSSGMYLACGFINDATEELRKIIDNTNWVSNETYWTSLKKYYDDFFSYDWKIDNMKKSIEKCVGKL